MEVENEPIVKETRLWLETISNFHEELQRLQVKIVDSCQGIRQIPSLKLTVRP